MRVVLDTNVLIAAFISRGDVTCIVTGDEDLLILKEFQGIDIIRPRDFAVYEAERI